MLLHISSRPKFFGHVTSLLGRNVMKPYLENFPGYFTQKLNLKRIPEVVPYIRSVESMGSRGFSPTYKQAPTLQDPKR